MSKAFVTGATGFLGINVIKELLDHNWEVMAFHLPGDDLSELSGLNIRLIEGDILDLKSLLRAIPQDKALTIFHIAGDTSMWKKNDDRQSRINVTGTRNVVEAALARGVRKLVYTSSVSAYGYHSHRIREDTPSNALSCKMNYNKTKYLAEQEIRKGIYKGLDGVILNPCNMLGPYDIKGWSTLIRSVVDEKVPALTLGIGTFAHVRDVAKAHIKAAESGRRGENYLLGGREAVFRDIYIEINDMLSKNLNMRTVPVPVFRMAMYAIRFKAFLKGEEPILTYARYKRLTGTIICDDSKARKELDFETTELKKMLSDSYNWLLSKGIVNKEKG